MPSWQVLFTKRFGRSYKKLHPIRRECIDDAIAQVALDPMLGERKKGDLQGVFVHKFKCQEVLYLLAYSLEEKLYLIFLEQVGSHQNFYRDLKG